MRWLGKIWRGEEALWKVFWPLLVLFPLGVNYFAIVLPLRLYGHVFVTYSYFWLFMTIFNTWLAVPLWRCAANTRWRVWTRLVRVSVLLIIGQNIYFVATGGLADLSWEQRAFETCRKIQFIRAHDIHVDPQQYIATHPVQEQRCRDSLTSIFR